MQPFGRKLYLGICFIQLKIYTNEKFAEDCFSCAFMFGIFK